MNDSSPKSGPTASKLLGAGESIELLARLRQAVSDLVARADETARDFSSRGVKLRAQFEQSLERERMRWLETIEAEKTSVASRRERAEARFESRSSQITAAAYNARQKRLAQIESEESKYTFEIQRQLLETEKQRETSTAANKTNHESFLAQLAAENNRRLRTEARARSTFGAYGAFARQVSAPPPVQPDLAPHENQLLDQLRARLEKVEHELPRVRGLLLPVLFRFIPPWLCVLLILGAAFVFVPALRRFDFATVASNVWIMVGVALAGVFALYFLGRRLAAPAAKIVAVALGEARILHNTCATKAAASFAAETERIKLVQVSTTQMLNNQWKRVQAEAKSLRRDWGQWLEEQAQKLYDENEERKRRHLLKIEEAHNERIAELTSAASGGRKQLESAHAENLAKLNAARVTAHQTIVAEWQRTVLPLHATLRAAAVTAQNLFPPWRDAKWHSFALPEEFLHAAKFGELEVDLEKLCGLSLQGRELPLPDTTHLSVPLLLSVPQQASLLFETNQSGQTQVIGALNNLVLRLLTSAPPGRLTFTIFDPVGLGQNFAGIMHLADFEERLINSRIWTQSAQFEQRLADLNEHIEKVTQMYLRNEYASLAEYNAQAGRLAEKYHFVVIADFPANFSDVAVKRLQSIAASGPRCGVNLLIHWDQRKPAPVEFVPEELRQHAICIAPKGDGFAVASCPAESERRSPDRPEKPARFLQRADQEIGAPLNWDGIKLTLDGPPDADLATKLLQQIGKASTDSYRVETPFEEAAPAENEIWSLETTSELRVPIGRTGATKLQYLALGQGTRQHGLVAGKTGSGKSTLFHVIITNLSLWCSPEQVEFYLVDFKKGVEFKCYAAHKLPHARVVAIESDREFGLSVLQRVDEELKRRGDLFRKLGAQDIAGYKRAVSGTGVSPVRSSDETHGQDARATTEPMPRVLLLIDEFQELFVEDDRVSQGAAMLLDRIVRQGRAFGIHVLLGSQTLGGAYTLARATIGQMVVRIALQCNEADAYLIMNEDNPAPRLLSRPGEAIYNDDGGAIQGNSPFQVVWLPDQTRDEWLKKVREFAERHPLIEPTHPQPLPGREQASGRAPTVPLLGGVRGGFTREPIVFEGNAPANVRDNPVLRALLDANKPKPTTAPRVFLGAPNSIKGPTEAIFRRQSGNHLLIVGQREEAALGTIGLSLVSLAAQQPKDAARFLVFDCSAADSAEAKFLERVVRIIPHEVKLVRPGEVDSVMATLAAEQQRRSENPDGAGPETYLLIHGLHWNKKLRFDEEMSFSMDAEAGANPGLQLNKLIGEGAGLGFHVIATCDTYNNVMRMVSRKALSEFEMRVLFQMSANDSASLIDSPAANNLGLHRAILFNGQEGWMETFRPYAWPDEVWLTEAGEKLARLGGTK